MSEIRENFVIDAANFAKNRLKMIHNLEGL